MATPAPKDAPKKARKPRVAKRRAPDRAAVAAVLAAEAKVSPAQKPNVGGRPPFVPTELDRRRVETLSGLGLKHEEIALLVYNPTTGLPIDEKTLRAKFELELSRGAPMANAKVAESLFRKAIGDGPQCVTAGIWWTKCRMGWKERVVAEVEIKSGVLVAPGAASPEAWVAAQLAANLSKSEPGTPDDGSSAS